MEPTALAATYSRISLDRAGDSLGVERQEEDCANLIRQRLWAVGPVYRENATSASTLTTNRRPTFERMLRHASEGRFSFIVAHSTSRLTRRPMDYERLMGVAVSSGIQVWTVASGPLDMGTADGRAMLRIMAAMDAAESERLAERGSRAARQRAQSGVWIGGSTPSFGYEFVADAAGGRRLVRNPTTAGWLRDAADKLLAGATLAEITAEWNHRGYRTAFDKRWRLPDVRRILVSPQTIGRREVAGVLSDEIWEPILSLATWTALRMVLLDPGYPVRYPRAPRRALSSLVFCAHCAAPMETLVNRNGYDAYECAVPLHRGCARARIRAEALEGYVLAAALARGSAAGPTHGDVDLSSLDLLQLRTIQADHYERLLGREDYRRQLERVLATAAERPVERYRARAWGEPEGLEAIGRLVLDVSVRERPADAVPYGRRLPTSDELASRVQIRWLG